MKLRGESGGVPARMGGARGGSIAKRAVPKKSSSVKIVPKKDMTTTVVDNINATSRAGWLKSGINARGSARLVDVGKPKATVKINTNPVKVKEKAKPVKVKPSVKVIGKRVIKIKSNNL